MAVEDDGGTEFDQSVLAPHIRRGIVLPAAIFALSAAIYLACAAGAVLASAVTAKILLGVIAGVFIANLAIIGHDAVHRSFTSSRWLNRILGTAAFLPALHPYGRWEHHHNRVHHRYTAQIGVDNAYSPMTVAQYRAAATGRRLYYRFIRSIYGQPFFYMIDIWLPKIFLPLPSEARSFRRTDWLDLAIVYVWLAAFVLGLTAAARIYLDQTFQTALFNALIFGFLIPFLVWNLFISFVTIVQHTSPRARWILPTGRPSTHEQKLRGTVHLRFPEPLDWFFHRVMQHIVHHVNPMVPLYRLKAGENIVFASEPERTLSETWTPLYHWRLARDCKLYDPSRDGWRRFDAAETAQPAGSGFALQ
jgi:omega-6 fatty acid desaturase (delta-12 desaturase)